MPSFAEFKDSADPLCVNDIVQAALNSRMKPKPLSLAPGEAPMKAPTIRIVIEHTNEEYGELVVEQLPYGLSTSGRDNMTLYTRIPDTHVVLTREEYERLRNAALVVQIEQLKPLATSEAAKELIQQAADEQAGRTPESVAIAATRAAHGLEESTPEEVYSTNPDAVNKGLRDIMRKPSVQPET